MNILLYSIFGYNKETDDFAKSIKIETDMDMKRVRKYHYTDKHRKNLENFAILAKEVTGKYFCFISKDGTILKGIVLGYSWDKDNVRLEFHLQLDVEPEANIEYSVFGNTKLFAEGDEIVFTNCGEYLPFHPEGVKESQLKIYLL